MNFLREYDITDEVIEQIRENNDSSIIQAKSMICKPCFVIVIV